MRKSYKSPATGFSYQDIVKEVKKKQALNKIFNKAHIIINKLGISNSVTYYFAKLVSNYKIFDLQRFHRQKQQLYIICFIYYHYGSPCISGTNHSPNFIEPLS